MSDKTALTRAELELTQRMQLHFPCGKVSAEQLHYWNSCPKEVLTAAYLEMLCKKPVLNSYLRLISGDEHLTISARDGNRTITKAKKTFKSYIDSDFSNWDLDKKGTSTGETRVQVHELIKDANFTQMFTCLSSDLDKLVLTQDQIIEFCEKNKNWLRAGGYATFFLFKGNGKCFVAVVPVHSDGLYVRVLRLENGLVWVAGLRLRLVSPQLTV